ncbi:MAG: FtsK/SpoIIIE domain-containing protein [Micrococcales bacterium]|nr:FtsK/SpoIIIE domain-containing protein [Micrococcales bacterium]
MRTRLLYRRPDGKLDPIALSTDAGATIGDVADLFLRVERSIGSAHTVDTTARPRMRVLAPGATAARVLSRDISVADAGLRAGSTVELDTHRPGTAVEPGPTAVRVYVTEGPDAGRAVDVPAGVATIGRDQSATVRLTDPTVSAVHARLLVGTSGVEIVDNGSANGLSIDGGLVNRVHLVDGDLVEVGQTTVQIRWQAGSGPSTYTVRFNRSPVVAPRYAGQELAAPTPPVPTAAQPLNWIALLAPVLLGAFTFAMTRSPMSLGFVALSPLMMLGSWIERRRSAKKHLARESKQFRTDLDALVDQVRADQKAEVAARAAEQPDPACWADAANRLDPLLWSRRPTDDDFLVARVGMGSDDSRTTVTLPPRGSTPAELWQTLTSAVEPLRRVEGVPLTVGLRDVGSFGIAGPEEAANSAARALVCQLLAQHSPAHLRLAVLASRRSARSWSWTPWLPHVPAGPWLASDPAAGLGTISLLEEIVSERTQTREATLPAVLVVVTDDTPVERGRLVRLATDGPRAGVHLLWCADQVTALPEACRAYLDVGTGVLGLPDLRRTQPLVVDTLDAGATWHFAQRLSGVVDSGEPETDETDLPRSVDYLTLVGRQMATRPDAVLERWRETGSLPGQGENRRQPATLRAVVGQGPDGQFVLDLRNDGPHALVGGTTGAGKSEFLQTWVLGMAAAHSPARATFLFVDYKGGAAFADCVDLPHCVGLVTDLTPHLVRRALTSLRAELHYREKLLASVKAKDLAAMERTGDPRTPPALVIVVDEFAALVSDVPQFVDGMVDVAQRGRSLGLHLVLATQRPAGVIRDNLRANTNLRIALRTADEHDSTDVVGVPVTAHIDPGLPGRAAVRTGPGRVTMFQTAYVGGRSVGAAPAPTIDVETLTVGPGRPWSVPAAPGTSTTADDDAPTDLRRCVDQVVDAARRVGLPAPRRPWLPELATGYELADLPQRPDELGLGMVDRPESQAQSVWTWRPDDGALAVFGAAGAGASTTLRSVAIAAGLADPGQVHVYGLDFGAGGLAMLEPLPHVGGILDPADTERVTRLLRDLLAQVEDRTRRFAAARAGSLGRYRELAARPDEPRIILLVDGMSAFRDAYETPGTKLASFNAFRRVLVEGRPLGVHVVIAAERPSAIPSSMTSAVGLRLVLRQADQNTYRVLDVPNDVLDNDSPPGRAVLAGTGQEIQLAVLGGDTDLADQARAVDALVARCDAVPRAPGVRRLATQIPASSLPDQADRGPVLGICEETLEPVGFVPVGPFLLAGPPGSGRTTAVAWLGASLHRWDPCLPQYYIGVRRSPNSRLPWWHKTATTLEDAKTLARELGEIVGEPAPATDDDVERPGVALIVESLADIVGTPAEQPLVEVFKSARRNGHLIVAESETPTWASAWPLVSEIRNTRRGIALTPDAIDGETLFRTSFGRAQRAQFPPGRGIYVTTGVARTVQLPLPDQ